MKKIITLLLMTLGTFGFSQGYKFYENKNDVTGTTIVKPISVNNLISHDFTLFNGYPTNKQYVISRFFLSRPDTCYEVAFATGFSMYVLSSDSVFLSDSVYVLANSYLPGSDPDSFGLLTYLKTCGTCIEQKILYRISTVANPSESAELILHYTCANSINEFDAGTISAAYPNPANHTVAIDYTLTSSPKNAKVVFYDMLGKTVKVAPIANKEGTVKINVADLHAGFYFYTFIVDGKSTNARKLVVSAN